jgi:hypothetical protein
MNIRHAAGLFLAGLLAAIGPVEGAEPARGPSRQQLDGADHYLRQFEGTVLRARGKPFPLRDLESEALRRIKALLDEYPEHPQVKDMFERARKALLASKGNTLEVTKEMLAYRTIGDEIRRRFAAEGEKEWSKLMTQIEASANPILKPFPRPDPNRVVYTDLLNRWLVADGFSYPMNEFSEFGRQFLYLGKPSTGFYYYDLSSPAWGGAYEAVRRYRRELGGDLPADLQWKVAGKITGVVRLIPEGGKEKVQKSQLGWIVEPVAIYIPGYTMTRYDPQDELGGRFAGEDQLEKIKGDIYTITSVPDTATPEEVAAAYITAIKEKNYNLFAKLVDPACMQTPTARSRAEYHWELHQHRWQTYYAHAELGEAEIEVLRGFDAADDVESAFLSDEDRAKIQEHAEEVLELATVWVKFYDERGRQVGSPSPFFLRRYGKKRWVAQTPSMPN